MKGFHVLLALPHAIRAAGEGADGLVVSGSESGGLRSMGSESSGMSQDYEVAVEEGATIVRIGRSIFGERPQ